MIKNLLLILVICFVLKAEAQNKDTIKLNPYYPAYFSELKTGSTLDLECSCHPQDPDLYRQWRGILINAPKIIYFFNEDSKPLVFPYCSLELIEHKREDLYGWDYTVFVKSLKTETIYSSLLNRDLTIPKVDIGFSGISYGTPRYLKEKDQLKLALKDGYNIGGSEKNLNLLDIIEFPFENGIYEIYIKRAGYESNHVFTEVVAANTRTLFYPDYFNRSKLSLELDKDCFCHPILPFKDKLSVLIDVPSEIYHYPKTDSTTIIPVCSSAYYPTKDDILSEGHIVEVYVKNKEKNKLYKGIVDFNGRNLFGILDDEYRDILNRKERKFKAASIPEAQMSTKAFNINALDFVKMPFEAGNYEVYIKRAGHESNHMPVKIVFFD